MGLVIYMVNEAITFVSCLINPCFSPFFCLWINLFFLLIAINLHVGSSHQLPRQFSSQYDC